MRSSNYIIKDMRCRLIVLALLVCQLVAHGNSLWQVEPRGKLSDAALAQSLQTFSIAQSRQCDHRKSENQNRATKKPTRILSGHHPERLVESTQSISGSVNFWFNLNQSVFERFKVEGDLVISLFVLYYVPTKRAPPLAFSFA